MMFSRMFFGLLLICVSLVSALRKEHLDGLTTEELEELKIIQETTVAWTPGDLEIHIFNVGQGDSQLIVYPSGFSTLIDVRESSWNSCGGAVLVAAKVEAILGGTEVDIGLVSHWHLDHIGYAGYGGFWCLLDRDLLSFTKIVDRDGGVFKDRNGDGVCDPDNMDDFDFHNIGTAGGTAFRWMCWATNPKNPEIYSIREVVQHKSTKQLAPPDNDIKVTIVMAEGEGVYQSDGVTPVTGNYINETLPPSENDFSSALLIEFGRFKYFTGGDLDGEYATSGFGYTYNDCESVVANDIGEVDVLRVNHHGSSHSSNEDFVKTLDPTVSLISCGKGNSYGHPAQFVLERLTDISDVFITETECAEDIDYSDVFQMVGGDIVIRSQNGATYSVNDKLYNSK